MTTQLKETVSAWPSSNPVFKPNANDAERRIRVAFVEDDDDFREAVSSELGDYGFDGIDPTLLAQQFQGPRKHLGRFHWSQDALQALPPD